MLTVYLPAARYEARYEALDNAIGAARADLARTLPHAGDLVVGWGPDDYDSIEVRLSRRDAVAVVEAIPGAAASLQDRCELLQSDRIDWRSFVALGGDIEEVIVEAGAYGDTVLARRARRAIARRGE